MDEAQLDYLDSIATAVSVGMDDGVGVLSTGERLYVALAGNRPDLMTDYTIPQALARLGEADVTALISRWRYA